MTLHNLLYFLFFLCCFIAQTGIIPQIAVRWTCGIAACFLFAYLWG